MTELLIRTRHGIPLVTVEKRPYTVVEVTEAGPLWHGQGRRGRFRYRTPEARDRALAMLNRQGDRVWGPAVLVDGEWVRP